MSIENINYVLEGIPRLKNKGNVIDENDVSFLNEYFDRLKVFFLLMDNLEKFENDQDLEIDDTQFDDVTNAVRKVSKKYRDAAKLLHILKKPHFKALFNSLQDLNNLTYIPEPYTGMLHEIDINFKVVDSKSHLKEQEYDSETISGSSEMSQESGEMLSERINLPAYQDAHHDDFYSDFQIIGVQRDHKQPLGITVTKHDFEYNDTKLTRCMVERILVNSIIDKQGLLQAGDIIFDVNDDPVDSPDALQRLLSKNTGTINFKILKSSKRQMSHFVNMEKSYVRALFDYDPSKDKLIPNENIGLPFSCGDVFEILNRDDPNFWQALPLDCTKGQALLIPSQSLQERRIALECDLKSNESHSSNKLLRKKSKKNELFRAQDAADIISEADLRTYEEVVKFPPSRVPCLLLIGPIGIGKRAIKHILVQKEPNRFAFPIQDTTEPKRGRNQPLFNHVDRNTMINEVKACLYVCVEEKAGEMYGIKSSTIRDLINQNKTVVLDCKPKDVYSLKLPQYNPYVILIAAPSLNIMEAMQKEGLQRNLTKNKRSTVELQDIIEQSNYFKTAYQHLINFTITNESFSKTVQTISSIISEFETSDSWIPASWENDIIPLPINQNVISRDSIKSPDNLSVGQVSLQRRFEKKSEKSLPISGNKLAIVGKSQDLSFSDHSSDTYSENEIVKAKPVKYFEEKRIENDLDNEDNYVQNKPKQRISLTRQTNKSLSKGESVKIKDDLININKSNSKVGNTKINSNVNTNIKQDFDTNNDVQKLQEKEVIISMGKEKNKLIGKESVKLLEIEPIKTREKDQIKLREKEIIKIHDKERIKSQEKEIIKPQERMPLKSQERDMLKPQEKVPFKSQERVPIKSQEKEINKLQEKERIKSQEKETLKPQEKERIKPQEREIVKPQEKSPLKSSERDIIKTQEKERIKSQERDLMKPHEKERIKLHEKEMVKPPGKERLRIQEKEIIKPQEKEIIKPQEKEVTKTQEKVLVQPIAANNRNQTRPKVIKMKESSSSDMSDTTSEEESHGIKVNRV